MKKILKKAIKNYSFHEIGLYASAFTYTAILSLPALLLSILFIVKMLYGSSDIVQDMIANAGKSMPGDTGEVLTQFLSNSIEITGFFTGIFTLAILFFSGTKLITYFSRAVNNSFGLRVNTEKSNIWVQIKMRFYGLIFIIFFIGVIGASVLFSTIFSSIFSSAYVLYISNFLISFAIYTCLYAFVLRFLVLVRINFQQAFVGGAFVSLLTIMSIGLITFALNSINMTSDFTLGASLILFLIWIYYLSSVIFFGFECVNVYLRENGGLTLTDLADEKYEKNVVVASPFLGKLKGAFGVLHFEGKIGKWFVKQKLKASNKS